MRSKQLPLEQLFIGLGSVYILLLAINGKLIFYIHPRYITFTIILSILCFIFVCIDFALNKGPANRVTKLNNVPIVLILMAGIILPAQSLTSATITQRSIDGINATNDSSTTNLFSQSSKALSIQDWSKLLESNNELDFYSNKTPQISGFVYDANLGSDTFELARFVVTCCAVDAQPLGVPVYVEEWNKQYSEDQWLEITGSFEERETTAGKQIVIVPQEIKNIEEPDNPYAN